MPLVIYAIVAIVILLLDIFIAFNFLKYRYQGDKTPLILFLAFALFALTAIVTLTLYFSAQATGAVPTRPSSVFH